MPSDCPVADTKVLCSACVRNGMKSTVRRGATTTTLTAVDEFYDENGVYHRDDPNTRTTTWWCSQGHQWVETRGGP